MYEYDCNYNYIYDYDDSKGLRLLAPAALSPFRGLGQPWCLCIGSAATDLPEFRLLDAAAAGFFGCSLQACAQG